MALNCFILCTAKQPIESNISHSSDKTFSEKQTAIFCLQRTEIILNTLSQSCYCEENSLEMLIQTTPFPQQDKLKQMLSAVFWIFLKPSLFLSTCQKQLWPHQCKRWPLGLWNVPPGTDALGEAGLQSSLGLSNSLATGESRWAHCQELFQQKFRKKILRSAESPDFQQFTV